MVMELDLHLLLSKTILFMISISKWVLGNEVTPEAAAEPELYLVLGLQ